LVGDEVPASETRGIGCGCHRAALSTKNLAVRTAKKKGTIPPERVASLEAVPGWVWDPLGAAWDASYGHLCAYVEEHQKQPAQSTTYRGVKLGTWVSRQRAVKKKGTMSPEREASLEAIPGWRW